MNLMKSAGIPSGFRGYKILEHLGCGGMGEVYKAIQIPLNRIVALKVLLPHFMNNEEIIKRFAAEVRVLSLLQHQNIVTIYEYLEDQGYHFYAMEFVEGKNLSQLIGGQLELSIREIVDISKQICRGLYYAHNHKVIHQDIKPQNILIDKNMVAKLSDFGVARILSGAKSALTVNVFATPEYMSPEQVQGRTTDRKTDIYSLGIAMYEMLTGQVPFAGGDGATIAYKKVHEQPTAPSLNRRDTPHRLDSIVLKALQKERRDRYQSIEEMLDNLDSVDVEDSVARVNNERKIGIMDDASR